MAERATIRPASRQTLQAFADSLGALREASRALGAELEWQVKGVADQPEVAAAREAERLAYERCRDLAARLVAPHIERETPGDAAPDGTAVGEAGGDGS